MAYIKTLLTTHVSYAKYIASNDVEGTRPIVDFIKDISNGTYKDEVEAIRSGDKKHKKYLPAVAFMGMFDTNRKKDDFEEASGLVIIDIDDVSDPEAVKAEIIQNKHVFAAMTSPSGNGVKVLYAVQEEIIDTNTYRAIGKVISNDFTQYGKLDVLSLTDWLIMTYDPKIKINKAVVPRSVKIPESVLVTEELEERDYNRDVYEDAEEFFETVLENNIAEKSDNNFHFIQIAMFDLCRFGFEHPSHDLSFVIDKAELYHKKSPDNRQRFNEMIEVAKIKGQTHWPYKSLGGESEVKVDKQAVEESMPDTSEEGKKTAFKRFREALAAGPRAGLEVSFPNFREIFRFAGTGVLTVTGIPGNGKTEFVDACLVDLARLHGEESLIVGYEQSVPEHQVKLLRKAEGADIRDESWLAVEGNEERLEPMFDKLTDMIQHIDTEKIGGNIEAIIEAADSWVYERKKSGGNPRYICIDPFNMLSTEHKGGAVEKIEHIFRTITHFSHKNGVMIILVAHPRKMSKNEKTGGYDVPDFYDVKGSSVFFEMSYHGLVVHREGDATLVRVLKVKQNNLGQREAECRFMYDIGSGRYIPLDEHGAIYSPEVSDHNTMNWFNV